MTMGTLYFAHSCHVVLEPVVALVHDLVDGKRRGRCLGMRAVVRGQRLGDLGEPVVEQLGRTRVERRHRADDAGLALRDHQRGVLMMNSGAAITGRRRRLKAERRWS